MATWQFLGCCVVLIALIPFLIWMIGKTVEEWGGGDRP